jgi:hypothetical protein
MTRSLISAFLLSALAAAAVWALSPVVTGQAEPWDAGGAYYASALVLAGLVAGFAFSAPLWLFYLGSIAGQLLYMVVFLPAGPLVVVGIGFLLVWSLLFLAGAWAGSRLRGRAGGRRRDAA